MLSHAESSGKGLQIKTGYFRPAQLSTGVRCWQILLLKLSRRERGSCFTFFSVLAAQQWSHFNLLKGGHKITDAVMWRQNLWTAHPWAKRWWRDTFALAAFVGTFGDAVPAKTGWTDTSTGFKWTLPDCLFSIRCSDVVFLCNPSTSLV